MTKHPVAAGLAIAAGLDVALGFLALAVFSAQEVPWVLFMVLLALPFLWFFAWIVLCGLAWWSDMRRGNG